MGGVTGEDDNFSLFAGQSAADAPCDRGKARRGERRPTGNSYRKGWLVLSRIGPFESPGFGHKSPGFGHISFLPPAFRPR
jgi:hypothetical protein